MAPMHPCMYRGVVESGNVYVSVSWTKNTPTAFSIQYDPESHIQWAFWDNFYKTVSVKLKITISREGKRSFIF
jgi:hypothetical protein